MVFYHLPPNVLFGRAGVGGGVGHDETCTSFGIQSRVEKLNPQVVRIVRARQAERKAAARSDGVLQPLLVHGVDVERWIGENEVESAGGIVRVVVVAVDIATVANVAFEPMNREIQAAETACLIGLLDTVNGKFRSGVLFMLGHEPGGLNEHAA